MLHIYLIKKVFINIYNKSLKFYSEKCSINKLLHSYQKYKSNIENAMNYRTKTSIKLKILLRDVFKQQTAQIPTKNISQILKTQ